ncbi:ABC transporter ATP-binding protein, partial [Streptomyces sp. H39-S7]|uniref:ABC transporter ATP-binding protein n=1 Tax=Streptomyces sp. H39-S7 TaxID=3004357 RepID=UPI0022AF7A19
MKTTEKTTAARAEGTVPAAAPVLVAADAAETPADAAVDPKSAAEPAIRVTGLRKVYGEVQAVKGIDLTIAPGEVVALLGPNGAGKSTTIDMVLGLSHPTSGDISIFGRAPYLAVREGLVSAVLQEGSLIDDISVRETLEMISSLYKKPLPLDEVLRRANIEDIVDRRGTKLSGGQRQRARFACALIGNPQLLVLDEPTSAMDVGSRRTFWESLRTFTDS